MSLRPLHILLLRVVRLWASRKGHNRALHVQDKHGAISGFFSG